MYQIEDFNMNDFEFIEIESITKTDKVEETYDIEVENKHYFYIKNIKNDKEECIVSHNTAEIMFGDVNDEEFLELKNPKTNKEKLLKFRWASNNSVFANVGMDYSKVAERTIKNENQDIYGQIMQENIQE